MDYIQMKYKKEQIKTLNSLEINSYKALSRIINDQNNS